MVAAISWSLLDGCCHFVGCGWAMQHSNGQRGAQLCVIDHPRPAWRGPQQLQELSPMYLNDDR